MASKPAGHELIGEYDCWSCGKPTPVKLTASGRLSAPCTWCDFSHYALPQTKHHAQLMAKVRKLAAPPPAPSSPPKPTENPPPAPPRAKYAHER